MDRLIDILLVLMLSVVVWQDLKQRAIAWYLIPFLLLGFTIKGLYLLSIAELVQYSIINFAFIGVQLLLLTIYFSIKEKRFINIINTYLGIGDILFFIVICTAFSTVNFILFYVLSLIFTLLSFVMIRSFKPNTNHEIPLAGAMAFMLIIVLIANNFTTEINMYTDVLIK